MFPLYHIITDKLEGTSPCSTLLLLPREKQQLLAFIKDHADHHDELYALIRYHLQKTDVANVCVAPYGGEMKAVARGGRIDTANGANCKFDLDKLPGALQHILFEFSRMAIKRKEEEKKGAEEWPPHEGGTKN